MHVVTMVIEAVVDLFSWAEWDVIDISWNSSHGDKVTLSALTQWNWLWALGKVQVFFHASPSYRYHIHFWSVAEKDEKIKLNWIEKEACEREKEQKMRAERLIESYQC